MCIRDSCTPAEATSFRSITCACLWGCQSRPEELSNVIALQSNMKTPKIKDLIAINTVVKRLRKPDCKTGIFFCKLRFPLHVFVVTDASGANKKSDHAVEGISLLVSEDRLKDLRPDAWDYLPESASQYLGGKCHLMLASSTKSKRISHSTSHAETLAGARGLPMGQLLAIRYCEHEIVAQKQSKVTPLQLLSLQDEALVPLPVDMGIDCMDFWELCCGYRGIPQDKSQRLAVLAIREERRTLRLRRLFHMRTASMLSDMLTKVSGWDSYSLKELVTTGWWTIREVLRVRTMFSMPPSSRSPWSDRDAGDS